MDLYTLTAHEIRDMIREKKISSKEATQSAIDRIHQVEDKVESYVTVLEEEALAQAQTVDARLAAGEDVGALAGVPMALKDNMCTKDVLTTCSSKMLYNFKPPYNATVAEKLQQAGTVMLGKVNMD